MSILHQGAIEDDIPTPCPVGYYGNSALAQYQSSFSCSGECPPQHLCTALATVTPTPCPPGHYCEGGIAHLCPGNNTYPDPLSLRASVRDCRSCPSYSTTLVNDAVSKDECGCQPGYYAEPDDLDGYTCTECPLGAVCGVRLQR